VTTSTKHDHERERQRPLRHDRVALKRLRLAKGLHQAELAALVGCTQPHISDLERGAAQPGAKLLPRLAWHLDCDVTELMAPALQASATREEATS
jgi:transcriptional regulator with XRE-family HTH domain